MRTAAAVAALMLALGAAGCSEEAEPSMLPPVESSGPAERSGSPTADGAIAGASPSAASVATSSVPVPDAAKAVTPEGASAFSRHYMVVLQAALASGDIDELQRISDPGCGGCTALISAIRSAQAAGQRVTGGAFTVVFAEAPAIEAGETTVDLRYVREPGTLVDTTGAVVERIAAEGPVDAQMRMRAADGDWLVLGFRQVQK